MKQVNVPHQAIQETRTIPASIQPLTAMDVPAVVPAVIKAVFTSRQVDKIF